VLRFRLMLEAVTTDLVFTFNLKRSTQNLQLSTSGRPITPSTIIGLDLAKHVFQVHGIDAAGKVLFRKKLRRSELKAFFTKLPACLVGMEACGTAHYWGCELSSLGHDVRLMPAAYVKALCQTRQDRRGRCRGDLRGRHQADNAVCAG
jgi:hypothetical protein